ncbi:anhydro-N-acetylmuramic acid kinase [Pseudoteredinibacter isoporae]|uniref:Anhydro-N-acetylmuramic acid kinase n=1 Tax=Pseudoteredinibacter isoporae TaxID=570281 RepID=A0A7X0JP61_9GAMM|nr:anhydro-N-acetylmuramic acid kinase [Pseudoteredinibacter isoporae]MBB6519725.1 anhydro-N-acetylmuramic acid kinase [Pseudoteredinibacter isoporae]NHO85306.1 anhydro-N-acetylmuramic acid kinase [Pseudoteredinibacter isoporae]NIB26242.1 anhydro-N-acetylmuramic acid kinase [Pseudoteredinibacter isoporae]
MSRELYIGLMSGTSADGLDAALIAFDSPDTQALRFELIDSIECPLPANTKQQVTELALSGPDEIHKMAELDISLAESFAGACLELLERQQLKPEDIRAIGSHGQTIRHIPQSKEQGGYTLQIGDPSRIAEMTGITTVADFRRRDIAAGGHGAPLAPAFHHAAFQDDHQARFIVNIGGMANVTHIPAKGCGEVIGFDTGPGNALMDGWIQTHKQEAYDKSGLWAEGGKVNEDLLTNLLAHPFLALTAPKSTGREAFNLPWLKQQLSGIEVSPQDVQASLLAFTAQTIADQLIALHKTSAQPRGELYICGGGAHNQALMKCLESKLPNFHISSTAELGVHPDWVEAITFAWLARQCVHQLPGNLPSVTGARGGRILGAIYPA